MTHKIFCIQLAIIATYITLVYFINTINASIKIMQSVINLVPENKCTCITDLFGHQIGTHLSLCIQSNCAL